MTPPKRPPLFSSKYPVGEGIVLLTIAVGQKQMGSSAVWLDNVIFEDEDFIQFEVGKGSEIKGKKLSIKTVVADVNDVTNLTSTTIELSGGVADFEHTLSVEVDDNGDSAIYRSQIEFT